MICLGGVPDPIALHDGVNVSLSRGDAADLVNFAIGTDVRASQIVALALFEWVLFE